MTDLYAIIRESGPPDLDLDLETAVAKLMEHVGRVWEIRKSDGLYSLWVKAAGGWNEWTDCWGLSERQVMTKLIGRSMGSATLLPMTMVTKSDLEGRE